jgi:hypothetical protein
LTGFRSQTTHANLEPDLTAQQRLLLVAKVTPEQQVAALLRCSGYGCGKSSTMTFLSPLKK